MSDIFDHALDAFESLDRDSWCDRYIKDDPLYHHTEVHIQDIKVETQKAYLLEVPYGMFRTVDIWIPKKWIRKMNESRSVCYIWSDGYHKNLNKALQETINGKR